MKLWIDYERLSRPLPDEEWQAFLLKIREERIIREAFPNPRAIKAAKESELETFETSDRSR